MHPHSFLHRHIGPSEQEISDMLAQLGYDSLDALMDAVIPQDIRRSEPLRVPEAMTEHAYLMHMRQLAAQNKAHKNFIGQGYYGTITPPVIQRNMLESPYWYTAYTPYQAEISQGRMESLLNFQTLVSDLTGLPLANASLLDEATAAAEAMTMLLAVQGRREGLAPKFFVDQDVYPQTLSVLKTRAVPLGIEIVTGDAGDFEGGEGFFAVLIQYPSSTGAVRDWRAKVQSWKSSGLRVAVATDLLALTLLEAPGAWGADVAFGSAQRLGVPMGFGGPHAAFFGAADDCRRFMPGRIIGVSLDAEGRPALRMALQTREQHIRRDKATSNICTAQALLANMAAMYAVYHGPEGLRKIATQVHHLAQRAYQKLRQAGVRVVNATFFDTLTLEYPDIQSLRKRAEQEKINIYYRNDGRISFSFDETHTAADVDLIVGLLAPQSGDTNFPDFSESNGLMAIPAGVQRHTPFLTHPVFNTHHSETELMRYISGLERKDIGLNFSMISLGSCTMKLNAAAEMMPISWPEFAAVHPFTPEEQVPGYMAIIRDLENWLADITGFDAVSLQPNSGAQGEYAGLLAIRSYLESIGQGHRRVALIPSSAHGTNPASAVMAGLEVVVVSCDDRGNIRVDDVEAKAQQFQDKLACLMVTYPSTHGVYEKDIRRITEMVHKYGGQVYMDGANMNAQVGLTAPALIGADVCHLNLHKTFAIPHGGGGPGMGPIGVRRHLAPFLPGHFLKGRDQNAVAATPYGSALILLISYGYIRLLGPEGLKKASEVAILNANYLKHLLQKAFPPLYSAENGTVAHEFIMDCRDFKRSAGVEVADIAKRLMDYGFHAPTVSFPVAGTLMVEPTESESRAELDRFAEVMIAIREEIRAVEEGRWPRDNNPLKHAPHTASVVASDTWDRPYSRRQAVFPLSWVEAHKFWPPVSRVNDAHGDRHLVCTCPPLTAYEEQAVPLENIK
ncbi:MAG: aminomethyl-transferring glycine dehydrogenase [Flavobacteriales bacterium]|nr:aminomethyl-transferring glycine dehydrogenase [Flavobacteriales bacterium]MCX7649550.1 aminomethyl-transferring glycine dehydrogenase [Flavobacteriales bacterium]MDW8431657.1 aminomethyl-transferring glycine dehydrogenase [Flavobacteriales bacterium]